MALRCFWALLSSGSRLYILGNLTPLDVYVLVLYDIRDYRLSCYIYIYIISHHCRRVFWYLRTEAHTWYRRWGNNARNIRARGDHVVSYSFTPPPPPPLASLYSHPPLPPLPGWENQVLPFLLLCYKFISWLFDIKKYIGTFLHTSSRWRCHFFSTWFSFYISYNVY